MIVRGNRNKTKNHNKFYANQLINTSAHIEFTIINNFIVIEFADIENIIKIINKI